MLYYLSGLSDLWSPMRVFQYITVRAIGAAITIDTDAVCAVEIARIPLVGRAATIKAIYGVAV